MAYVRRKAILPEPEGSLSRRHYYQLVESRRVDGKPRQKVLLHLGEFPSVAAALEGLPKKIAWFNQLGTSAKEKRRLEEKLERLQELRNQGIV
jgi:hypothetical protein